MAVSEDPEAQKVLLKAGSAPTSSYGATEEGLLDTDIKKGLSSQEAEARLKRYGPNELEDAGKDSFLKILLTQMCSVIFLLTSLAALIVHLTAKTDEDEFKAKFLISLVVGVCLMNAIGEFSGQDAGAALRAKDPEKCKVVRNGEKTEIPVAHVVPGDIVEVGLGDMVPADMKILVARDLQTNEAPLTGEPNEVAKTVEPKDSETAFPTNMLYKMTCVQSGSGIAIVTATGMSTQVGLIADNLKVEEKGLCPLQRTVNALGRLIALGCGCLIVFGCISSHMMGYSGYPPKCPPRDAACANLDNIVRGLLMAVTLIPHGLPLVVMVMLRVGSQLMADRNAFVTRQSAVDYLGATNVICTDKTGTLTEGKMAAISFVSTLRGAPDKRVELGFYPLKGLNPKGRIFNARDLTESRKKAMDHSTGADFDKAIAHIDGLQDLGDLSKNAKGAPALLARATAATCYVNCWATSIQFNEKEGAYDALGNMSEGALKVAAWKGHYVEGSAEGKELEAKYPREADLEVPFTSARKMSASIHQLASSSCFATLKFGKEHTHFAVLKGAPDRVMKAAKEVRSLEVVDGETMLAVSSAAMDANEKSFIERENGALASKALRSLLLAVRPLTEKDMDKIRKCSVDEALDYLLSAGPFAFLGLFGIFDPPRTSVPPSVSECHEAGIRVVMITGDQRPTAVAIGKLVGIIQEGEEKKARICSDLHETSTVEEAAPTPQPAIAKRPSLKRRPSVLDKSAEKHVAQKEYKDAGVISEMTKDTNIWSRAQPTDKVCIVESLVAQKQISAMTGDGVNDAPALKKADIGVSMGIAGTAVTKNAADMVLMDDNFSTIVAAVKEGRKIYGNVQKYVLFNLSMKASECSCLLLAIFCNMPAPLGGIQQLVNMVCTHIIPPMSLAWEDAEEYTMKIKPRKTGDDLILNGLLVFYRWIPYVVCYAVIIMTGELVNIWMHTGYFQIDSLIPTSVQGMGANGMVACQSAGIINANGHFIGDVLPYHCTCEVSALALGRSERVVVDQWGQPDAQTYPFDKYSGDTGTSFEKANTPWKNGESAFVKPCDDLHGVTHMCWNNPTASHPTLPSFNCAAWGEKLGQSMTYASIQIGEVASLVTFRTDGPFFNARWSWLYFFVLCFNVLVYGCVNTIPYLTDKLSLAPLDSYHLCMALIAPVLLVASAEMIKVNYRRQLRLQHAEEGVHYGEALEKKTEEV